MVTLKGERIAAAIVFRKSRAATNLGQKGLSPSTIKRYLLPLLVSPQMRNVGGAGLHRMHSALNLTLFNVGSSGLLPNKPVQPTPLRGAADLAH